MDPTLKLAARNVTEICTARGCPNNAMDGEPGLPGVLCSACESDRWDGMLEEPFTGQPIPASAIPFKTARTLTPFH